MDSINATLKNMISKDLDKSYYERKNNPKIQNIIKNLKVDEIEAKRNLSSLEDCVEQLENCRKCKGFNMCKNPIKGHVYYPQKKESRLAFDYVACKYFKKYEEDKENKSADLMLAKARMKDIDIKDKKRVVLIKWLKEFYDKYDQAKECKGLYLHGTFGSGKTFLISALLNELKEKKNVNYEIVYFPQMLRNLKDNFSLLDSKVRYYSHVEILLIDDIGAEKVSDWGRDEILGTILQARMNNKLTTFFTSNLTIEELERHLATTKDSEDLVKARRIVERIKQLTEDIELISINRRS